MTELESPLRHCPECGMNTRKERCPDDHAPTIMLSGFKRDALSFRPDEIVAGRYRITGTLARGGYSAVYAASHHSTRQPVAIKMLSIQHHVDAMRKVVRRFWREAQITARMTSPHTVRIIDVGQVEDGPLFIAMERLRGRTLGSFLQGLFQQNLVMTPDEAIGMAVPILRCLEEAHDLGLVHRDLKPNNIMLARVGADDTIVKVLDFGVARVKDSSLTADGNTLGTPAYMSPEQFRAAKVDARSDLYSVGVILFLAVCGRLPFQKKNIHALGRQHINDPVPDPRTFGRTELSSGFVDALMCSLRKAPEERYQSARTMRQALELVRGGAASGLSVAHIQLNPAGQTLIDESVSARDSQAFMPGVEMEDATVGIHEVDATIGIEEIDAGVFAEALNPEFDAKVAPVAPTSLEGDAGGYTPSAGLTHILENDSGFTEEIGVATFSVTGASAAATTWLERDPALGANTEPEEIDAADLDTADLDTADLDTADLNTATPSAVPAESAALRSPTSNTDEDVQLGRMVHEALDVQVDPCADPESPAGSDRQTLELFSAAQLAAGASLPEGSEQSVGTALNTIKVEGVADLVDLGTPSAGVPTT
jgi:serine/threonine protein kinase